MTAIQPRILVTGANGFVGSLLVERLRKDGGAVSGVVRTQERMSEVPDGVELAAVGDIGPGTDWTRVLNGVDCVVHTAARVHVMRERAKDPLSEFRRVNVAGTRRLIEQAADAGVSRFVFLSSPAAVGGGKGKAITEATLCEPQTPYGVSKLEAESVVRQVGRERGIEFVILRPPVVYGPNVRGTLLRLMEILRRGVPLPVGMVRNRRSMLHVRNLVGAIQASIEHPRAAGATFCVADSHVSTPDLVRRLAHHMGVPARVFPMPVSILRAGARLLGKDEDMNRLVGSLIVDSSAITEALNWRPPFSMDDGFAEMAAQFRADDVSE